jgi:hypothetical protein
MRNLILLLLITAVGAQAQTPQTVVRTFRTLADMDLASPSRTETKTEVLGRVTPGDWGEKREFILFPESTAPTNEFIRGLANTNVGRRIYKWYGDAAFFGMNSQVSSNYSPILQLALNTAYSNGIPTVTIPMGWFVMRETVLFPPRVRIRSEGWANKAVDYLRDTEVFNAWASLDYAALDRLGAEWGTTVLARERHQTGRMFEFNTNLAALNIFYPSNSLQDGSVVDRWQASAGFEGIVFYGNNLEQTTWDQDLIRAENVWDFSVDNCAFIRARGYAINVLNGNGIHLSGNAAFGSSVFGSKGILGWHLSDCRLTDNYLFGGRGPAIWLSSIGGWRMPIWGNIVGNFDGHGWKTVTNLVNGVFTTDGDHQLESGMPVVLHLGTNTSSVLPTNAITTASKEVTMWVSKLSANTLGLHTNHLAHLSTGYLAFNNGTLPFLVGPGFASGLYVNDGSKQLAVANNRMDQNYDSGIRIAGGSRSSYQGNIVAQNGVSTGFGNTTNRPETVAGITVTGAGNWTATENKLIGNVLGQADYGISLETGSAQTMNFGNAIDNSEIPSGSEILFDSAATAQQNIMSVGATNYQTVMDFIGGSAGSAIIKLSRAGIASVGFGVTGFGGRPTLVFLDPTNSVVLATLNSGGGTFPEWRVGRNGTWASPNSGSLNAGEDGTGTNAIGGVTYVDSGQGTGGQTNGGYVAIRGSLPTDDGTNQQSQVDMLVVDYSSNTNHTSIRTKLGGTNGPMGRIVVVITNGLNHLTFQPD